MWRGVYTSGARQTTPKAFDILLASTYAYYEGVQQS